MSRFDSDGYDSDEACKHPSFAELRECEACERWFDGADRRLWVGWSGASITCVHCFFAAHAALIFDETTSEDEREDTLVFLDEMHDESGQPIGGIAGYRARFAAQHDRASCPWVVFGCLLCDLEALS